MVPTQLYRLLNSKALKEISESLKALLIGGGRVPHNLIVGAFKAGLPIYTSYGLTEMASQVTTTPSDADIDLLKTSGHVLNYRELKISDDNEILVRGETLSSGYIKRNEKYKLLDNDSWFHTGDMGSLDKNGYLTVSGRRDNMFISGGENIHPETIETAILRLNNIDDVVVVGIDDPEFGQRPVAFIKSAVGIDNKRIRDSLNDKLPGYMIPIAYYELPEDNKQGGIKYNRYKLKELAEQLYTSKIRSS
jgi:O-succinylbenzoic acid--CoA ligase